MGFKYECWWIINKPCLRGIGRAFKDFHYFDSTEDVKDLSFKYLVICQFCLATSANPDEREMIKNLNLNIIGKDEVRYIDPRGVEGI